MSWSEVGSAILLQGAALAKECSIITYRRDEEECCEARRRKQCILVLQEYGSMGPPGRNGVNINSLNLNLDFGRSEVWRYRFRILGLIVESTGVYETSQEHCGEHAQP